MAGKISGKRVQLDPETKTELENLADDRMMTFQELFEEALRDLLRKYDRPVTLKEAFRKSAGKSAEIVPLKRDARPTKKAKKKARR
jgi:hypothetical protein